MSENVYIIGAGIHPFGRTDGRSGREQGVYAVREALSDAGLEWPDIECAYGGSAAAGNADIMVNELGLTSLPFTNVANGCATGGSALAASQQAIASGMYDLALAVGFDKHPRGAFNAKPADYGLPEWYGQTGMMLTTQFFALKIQRYMQLHGISRTTLGRVAEKAFRNGTLTPPRMAAQPGRSRDDPQRADDQRSADQVYVLLARRGRGGADPRVAKRRCGNWAPTG